MASISAGDGKALSLAALDDAAGGGVRATSASAVMFAAAAACPASSSISSSRTTALSRLGIGPRYGRRHHIRTQIYIASYRHANRHVHASRCINVDKYHVGIYGHSGTGGIPTGTRPKRLLLCHRCHCRRCCRRRRRRLRLRLCLCCRLRLCCRRRHHRRRRFSPPVAPRI